jgi:hypothetical protein
MGSYWFRLVLKAYNYSKLITYYQKTINDKILNPAFIAGNQMVAARA